MQFGVLLLEAKNPFFKPNFLASFCCELKALLDRRKRMDLPWDDQTEGSIQAEGITSPGMVVPVSVVTVLSWCNTHLFSSPSILGCRRCLFTPLPQGIPFDHPWWRSSWICALPFSFLPLSFLHPFHDQQLQFWQVFLHWIVGSSFSISISVIFPPFFPFYSCLDRRNLFSFLGIFPKDVFLVYFWAALMEMLAVVRSNQGLLWEISHFPSLLMFNPFSQSLLTKSSCPSSLVSHWCCNICNKYFVFIMLSYVLNDFPVLTLLSDSPENCDVNGKLHHWSRPVISSWWAALYVFTSNWINIHMGSTLVSLHTLFINNYAFDWLFHFPWFLWSPPRWQRPVAVLFLTWKHLMEGLV